MTRIVTFGLVMAVTATVQAGVLDGHPAASMSGSVPFSSGTLTGFVEYAVFNPGDYPFAGHSQTAGQAVYAYQTVSTGAADISSHQIFPTNDASSPFVDSTVAGNATSILSFSAPPAGSAHYNFDIWLDADLAGSGGDTSKVYGYESSKLPELTGLSIEFNGGLIALATPIPVPSTTDIPEPTSMALLAVGGLVMLRRRR